MSPVIELESKFYYPNGYLKETKKEVLLDVPDIDGTYQTHLGEIDLKIEKLSNVTHVYLEGSMLTGRERTLADGKTTGPSKRRIDISPRRKVGSHKIDADTKLTVTLYE